MAIENSSYSGPTAANSPIALVQTTVADLGTAQKIARALVETNDAACVQLTPIMSIYRWEERIEDAKEFRIDIKTAPEFLSRLLSEIKRLHPYDVPEILVHPNTFTTPAYSAWVQAEVG